MKATLSMLSFGAQILPLVYTFHISKVMKYNILPEQSMRLFLDTKQYMF